MIKHFVIVPLAWLTTIALPSAGAQAPRGIDKVTPSEKAGLADSTATHPDVSTEEAIRTAVEAIDQLESTDNADTHRALIDTVVQSSVLPRATPGSIIFTAAYMRSPDGASTPLVFCAGSSIRARARTNGGRIGFWEICSLVSIRAWRR